MVFTLFFIAAIFTVLAAIKLSTYADVLSERTALGGMLVGTILLAGATSLPEVTTSLTAIAINNPDLAVGNVLGSNLFNLLILASFDLYFRKKQLFKAAQTSHLYTITLGMLLTTVVILSLIIKLPYSFLGIGVDTLLIAVIYAVGMFLLSKNANTEGEIDEDDEGVSQTSAISLRRAIIGFVIAAIVILISGSMLSIAGDKIAEITGLGSSFVGSFLIAATTSLPEAVAVLIAIQLRNYNLAIGSILGSNIFNMLILGGSDIFYRNATILSQVSPEHAITAIATLILSLIVLYSLLRSKFETNLKRAYWVPSAVVVVAYFVSSYLIFIN